MLRLTMKHGEPQHFGALCCYLALVTFGGRYSDGKVFFAKFVPDVTDAVFQLETFWLKETLLFCG